MDPGTATLGAAAIGAIGGAAASGAANARTLKMARENRRWQEKMSNTAHQRETQDLLKAGLNPMLSTMHQGANTPTPPMPEVKDIGAAATHSAAAASQTALAIQQARATIDLTSAQADKVRAETMSNDPETGLSPGVFLFKKLEAELNQMVASRDLTTNQVVLIRQEVQRAFAETKNVEVDTDIKRFEARLRELHIPEAEAIANFFRSELGKMSPYIRPIGSVIGGVGSAFGAASVLRSLSAGARAVKGITGKSIRPSSDGRGDYVHMPTGELYK